MIRKKSEKLRKGVEVIDLDARPLVSVIGREILHVKDSLVRYYPIQCMTAFEVATKVKSLKVGGAVAVRVQPAINEDAAVLGDEMQEELERPTYDGIRDAVTKTAERIKNIDQEKLQSRVSSILSEVGE